MTHRTVNKPCCPKPKVVLGYRWRPPKKRDDRAWRLLEQGHWLYENDRPTEGEVLAWNRAHGGDKAGAIAREMLDNDVQRDKRKGRIR